MATGLHVAVTLSATAALYGFSHAFLAAPCWVLFFVVGAVAWPIWRHQREHALFERRAILAGLTNETSRVRRWFWTGQVTVVIQVFVAMFWATLLVSFASLLGPWHWIVLAVDALILALLVRPITLWLAHEVRPEQTAHAARRWPLAWINIAILGLAFFLVDFYVAGAPDTRGVSWHELAGKEFLAVYDRAPCAIAGALAGGLKTIDSLAWHAAEILIPSLPNPGLKWVAWGLFLLQAGVLAFALTRLHVGLLAFFDRRALQPEVPAKSSRAFFLTMAVVLAICAAAALALRDFDVHSLATKGRQVVAWADPCRSDAQAIEALKASLDSQLEKVRVHQRAQVGESVDAAVDAVFVQAESGVDAYLDWYFTVPAEYKRLGAVLLGKSAELMSAELEQRVFGDVFRSGLEEASREIATATHDRISKAATALGGQLQGTIDSQPCLLSEIRLPAIDGVKRDALHASTAAVTGVGAATGLLAREAAKVAAAKAASKRLFQAAGGLAGRALIKRAGFILIPAAGAAAFCGPLAVICGASVWITLDKAFIKVDELRFRGEMRAELLESLRIHKAEVASGLRAMHEVAIDQAVSDVQKSVQRVFIPAREGV